jgi:hypothetical protein
MSKYPRIHPAREERAHDFRAEIGQPNIAGRLGRNQAPVGALISVAGAPMNTLVQLDPIYVTFNPSETDLVVIQRARAAGKVAADTLLPGETQARHGGELTFIDNAVDRSTRRARDHRQRRSRLASRPIRAARFSPQIMRGIMRAVGAIMRSPNMDRRF